MRMHWCRCYEECWRLSAGVHWWLVSINTLPRQRMPGLILKQVIIRQMMHLSGHAEISLALLHWFSAT